MEKQLIWTCKCQTSYAIERNVPTVLHAKHPERKKCNKCDTLFPDQEKRDQLYQQQNLAVIEE